MKDRKPPKAEELPQSVNRPGITGSNGKQAPSIETTRGFGQAPAGQNGSVLEPDIPELKKKEKERKGGAIPWLEGAGPGSAEIAIGAAGRAAGGSASWSFLGSARIAAYLSELFGGSSSGLGALFSSNAGSLLVTGGMVAWGALMMAAGVSLYNHFSGGAGGSNSAGPMLGGVGSDGLVVRKPSNDNLNGVSNANRGEILFDAENPLAPKPDGEKKDEVPPPVDQNPVPPNPVGINGGLDALRDQFIKKMTKDPQDLMSGGFGGKLASSLGSNVPKFALPGLSSLGLPGAQKTAKLAAFRTNNKPYTAQKMSIRRGISNRAMGQLKLARNMSTTGAQASGDETQRNFEANAFDQRASQGGQMNQPAGISSGAGESVVPPGGGASAPDMTPPANPTGVNVTPWQPNLDFAGALGNLAAALRMLGMMLMMMGIVLIALGLAIAAMPPPSIMIPIGMAIVAIGVMLMTMGISMMSRAKSMANMGSQIGQSIANQSGQKDQGAIVSDCMNQAANNGTRVQNCTPSDRPQVQRGTVQQDARTESNATYTLDGGNTQASPPTAPGVTSP